MGYFWRCVSVVIGSSVTPPPNPLVAFGDWLNRRAREKTAVMMQALHEKAKANELPPCSLAVHYSRSDWCLRGNHYERDTTKCSNGHRLEGEEQYKPCVFCGARPALGHGPAGPTERHRSVWEPVGRILR